MNFIEIIQLLCSPLNQALLLGFCAWCLPATRRHLKRTLLSLSVIWLLLCSQYSFSHLLMRPLEAQFPALPLHTGSAAQASQIFVLGGYINANEDAPAHTRLSTMTQTRLDVALHLYAQQPRPMLITGGYFTYRDDQSYAALIAALLRDYGVRPEHIVPIPHGTNTGEELTAVAAYLQGQHTVLISTASHLPRIAQWFTTANNTSKVTYFPVGFRTQSRWQATLNSPSLYALETSRRAMYEYAALLWYKIKQAWSS
jgi:uncharacterized SAM-binding protein YcdF (DUF218 family)